MKKKIVLILAFTAVLTHAELIKGDYHEMSAQGIIDDVKGTEALNNQAIEALETDMMDYCEGERGCERAVRSEIQEMEENIWRGWKIHLAKLSGNAKYYVFEFGKSFAVNFNAYCWLDAKFRVDSKNETYLKGAIEAECIELKTSRETPMNEF